VIAGCIADKYGRKLPIFLACFVFVIGTVLQTVAYHLPQFAVGRFVVGLGVGSAAMVVPLYISELAPAKYRGRMIAFNNMSVTFGQFLASSIGAGFAQVGGENSQAWRATVGIGAAPAIILAGLLTLCPESPRQLVTHGKVDEASVVLTRIYPTSTEEQRRAKIASIEMSINEATQTMVDDSVFKTLARIFTTPSTFRSVFTACTIMAISQLSGSNTLMYYSCRSKRFVRCLSMAVVSGMRGIGRRRIKSLPKWMLGIPRLLVTERDRCRRAREGNIFLIYTFLAVCGY
jgi:SP family myo-inositol transporter-like MFS transporter 13